MATSTVTSTNSVASHDPTGLASHVTTDPRSDNQTHDVEATLNFFKDNEDGSPPAPAYIGRPETYERPVEPHRVIIHDVTGDEDKYTLDSHGFQYHRHTSVEKAFVDDAQIKDAYYKEVDTLLKEVTGASKVFIFDHTVRRPSPEDVALAAKGLPKPQIRSPVLQVHIDQSYSASLSRVPFHLPKEADRLLKGRVQIINVWRPIKTIRRDPLAVSVSQSVVEKDLVPISLIYETRKGETLSVRYHPDQQWHYKYHQTPEEVLLIKCFDNQAGVGSDIKYVDRAKRVPHSAFEVAGTESEEARESIEVRCLVFHEQETS